MSGPQASEAFEYIIHTVYPIDNLDASLEELGRAGWQMPGCYKEEDGLVTLFFMRRLR